MELTLLNSHLVLLVLDVCVAEGCYTAAISMGAWGQEANGKPFKTALSSIPVRAQVGLDPL